MPYPAGRILVCCFAAPSAKWSSNHNLRSGTRMNPDPIDVLEAILKRNGLDADLRNNESYRYFLFDSIADPADLDLAWSQFPAHAEIRARAAQVDAVSDIVSGWGYRIPKKTNRCSDEELRDLVRRHISAIRPMLKRECYEDVVKFLEKPNNIEIVGDEIDCPAYTPGMNMADYWNSSPLVNSLDEAAGDWMIDHFSHDELLHEILYDWAIYLTKCDEVAMYLLWPTLKDVADYPPDTPNPGFELWRYNCRANYWIKNADFQSGVVYVQPPWRLSTPATT